MKLWPRLPMAAARELYLEVSTADLTELRDRAEVTHAAAAPAPVGGTPVERSTIESVQAGLRDLADSLGFPDALGRQRAAAFDQPATRILHEQMQIVPADAASTEVWNFVSLVVLPDIAVWRFPSRAENRILGHPRNTFRRLWWRGEVVGPDLIDAPAGLGEDELVNIMERPTLAANPVIARALAERIVALDADLGIARSEVMRDVAKRVLRLQASVNLDVLSREQLDAVVTRCLNGTLVSLRLSLAHNLA